MDATDAHHDRATALLFGVESEALGMSPLSLAEVLVGPGHAGRLGRAVAALDQLEVTSVNLDRDAPTRLAVLRAGSSLKLPDCCVLLVAQEVHGAVATFDDALAAAARGGGLGVRDP